MMYEFKRGPVQASALRARKTKVLAALVTAVVFISVGMVTASAQSSPSTAHVGLGASVQSSDTTAALLHDYTCRSYYSAKRGIQLTFNVSTYKNPAGGTRHAVLDVDARSRSGGPWSNYRLSFMPREMAASQGAFTKPMIQVPGEDGYAQAAVTRSGRTNTRIALVAAGSWTTKRFAIWPTAVIPVQGYLVAERGSAKTGTYQFYLIDQFTVPVGVAHNRGNVSDNYGVELPGIAVATTAYPDETEIEPSFAASSVGRSGYSRSSGRCVR